MTFAQFNRKVARNNEAIVARAALRFNADIVSAWPVDTGFSKGSWQINKSDATTWTVSNNTSYSPILWRGRIGNKGSWQLPQGGDPILRATEIRTVADMKRNLL